PQADADVVAGRGQGAAVGGEGDGLDGFARPLHAQHGGPRGGVGDALLSPGRGAIQSQQPPGPRPRCGPPHEYPGVALRSSATGRAVPPRRGPVRVPLRRGAFVLLQPEVYPFYPVSRRLETAAFSGFSSANPDGKWVEPRSNRAGNVTVDVTGPAGPVRI